MEESNGSGAPSNLSKGFQIRTLGWRFETISIPELSITNFLCAPRAIFSPFWDSSSLEGVISHSSNTSLPFFSLFLFFSSCSKREVWVGRRVGGRGWTATSGVDPLHVTPVAYVGAPWLQVCQLALGCY